ncbi:MAG: hypothetical protein ACREQI_02325 [Candidatus Binataceae bacterium]
MAIALLGYGFYTLWNSGADYLFDASNYLAYGAIGFAMLIEFIDRD